MKKGKTWLIIGIFLIGFLIFMIIIIPKILDTVFERTTRILEHTFIRNTPEEYHPRIKENFAFLITAYKKDKVKREDLEKLSKLIRKAYEDKHLTIEEIEEILSFIENITPEFK